MSELTREILFAAMPDITEAQADMFSAYYELLVDWNTRMNLTRITEPVEVAEKHFADSIIAESLIPAGARVIDVGTGAGFPGIPLRIVRPDIELVLVDSLGKRVKFLEEVCSKIGLPVPAIHARAEDAARDPSLRGTFDTALSRAVAPMNVLLELTVPFLKVGGSSLMYKAANAEDELAAASSALKTLGCRAETHEYSVSWGARVVVEAKKLYPTDKKFPRKAGTAERSPL